MVVITAWVAGLVFGLGLMMSGMANPAKVLSFLDFAGVWDPSLAFVMLGAILLASLGFFIARRGSLSWLGLTIQWPSSTSITWRLILGSATFGIGWGLAGFCPGPALVALGAGYPKAVGFVLAMLAGMMVFELIEHARTGVERA